MAATIAELFGSFPTAIIGAMMFMVGIELMKFAGSIRPGRDLAPLAITLIVALAGNMAFGFLAGMGTHYLLERILPRLPQKA